MEKVTDMAGLKRLAHICKANGLVDLGFISCAFFGQKRYKALNKGHPRYL